VGNLLLPSFGPGITKLTLEAAGGGGATGQKQPQRSKATPKKQSTQRSSINLAEIKRPL